MLNELKIIADGLDEIGEGVELIHRDIFLPGGSEALRIVLGETESIDSIEYMDAKQLANCWGIRTSKQDQFPCIKLTSPLRLRGNEFYSAFYSYKSARKKDEEKAKEELIEQCQTVGGSFEKISNYKESELVDLLLEQFPYEEELKLSEWPKKSYRKSILSRLDLLKDGDKEEIQIVANLYRRYTSFDNDGLDLLRQLSKKIEETLKNNSTISSRILLNILFGENKVNNKGDVKDVTRSILVLDYKPSNLIDEFATARHRVNSISRYLINKSPISTKSGTCFLTGKEGNLYSDKFPDINLGKGKGVSQVILFSKFDGNANKPPKLPKPTKPTVQRYGRSGTNSYCLDNNEGSRLAETLIKITGNKYKGKIWESIPSEGKTQDLLIAFCRSPSAMLTPIITGCDIDDIDDYVNATSDVINSFRAGNLSFDEEVYFIILRKIDDGNQKIIYSISNSIEMLRVAADEWVAGCNNSPNFKLFAQIGKAKELLSPWPVAPQRLVYLSKQKYIRDGQVSTSVPAISFSDLMKLFFSKDDSATQLAKRCLMKLSVQYEPLFSHCTLSKVQNVLEKKAQIKAIPKNNTQALNAVTLLSVLLYKIGRNKEVYMNGFAYQLGQLCSAIDELHIGYCVGMRGGQVPNALIGNLTYSMALQNPTKALAALALRLKPYESWVRNPKTMSPSDNKPVDKAVKASFYAHKWLANQSVDINKHFIANDIEVNDTYKAELMLGYLAGRPFEGKGSQSNTKESQGEK